MELPQLTLRTIISIHALREEGDLFRELLLIVSSISIHALCEEGDEEDMRRYEVVMDFYPRPPRGGRPCE